MRVSKQKKNTNTIRCKDNTMWILVVLSTFIGSDEVRLTYYDAYQTENKCSIERSVLEATFTEGEQAVCVKHRSTK